MKLQELTKQLKGFGHYSVDVQLSMLPKTILGWVKEDGLQLIPDFQRGHVWTTEQKSKFVEFLLRGGKTQPLLFNHPGWMSNFNGDFVCVDGLQRITAILEFMNDEVSVFDGYCKSEIEDVDLYVKRVYMKVFINDLATRKEVIEWYLELNEGGTPHTQEELDRVKKLLANEV